MGKSRFGKVVAVALAVSVAVVFSAGCFGKFQLTRSLYEVNKSVPDKYLRSVLTWVLIIPYGVTGFLDFAVFNLIEFWSGENPIAVPQARAYESGDDRAEMTIDREGGATVATIRTYRAGALVSTIAIRDDGSGPVTSTLCGEGEACITRTATPLPDGSISVATVSADGMETVRYSPAAVETHRARVARIAGEAWEAPAGGSGSAPFAALPRVPARQG